LLKVEHEQCAQNLSEGTEVDKLRRDSSFVIPRRRTQEVVRRSIRSGGILEKEKPTVRVRRGA
jgi:hypothetical protein